MTKKTRTWIIAAFVLLAVLAIFALIFRKPFLHSAEGRVLELLHHTNKVQVKGDSLTISSRDFLGKYYTLFGYKKNWTDSTRENDKYRNMLILMLDHADSLGLDRKDYHEDYIIKFDSLSHLPYFDYSQFESENELIFTDAALSFLYHVAYGKEIPIGYNGVKYNIDSTRILNMFNDLLAHQDWRSVLDSLEPKIFQYRVLKTELNRMEALLRKDPSLDSSEVTNSAGGRTIAILRLKAYGLMADSLCADSVNNETMRAALKGFQQMMSTDTTGRLDAHVIALLNFPLSRRIEQIKESLNYWRWTGRLREREFILVNIPATRLQIVRSDSANDIGMKVIVGKTSTPTPSFTAYINKVISYPYWTVPFSIATKEMLPKIRKQLSYLDDNNLQVINGKGEVIDPQTLNWTRYSEHYFPYTIRQSTGCDNSLGVLKFELNSPFSIYLHDTNARGLFAKKDRFLSHGCIRLEKPMVLAEYLLGQGLDTATVNKLNQCMKDQTPADFKLKKRFPVLIFYMTADVDEHGKLKFYNDVYGIEGKREV